MNVASNIFGSFVLFMSYDHGLGQELGWIHSCQKDMKETDQSPKRLFIFLCLKYFVVISDPKKILLFINYCTF